MVAPSAKFCKEFSVYGVKVIAESWRPLEWLTLDFAHFINKENDLKTSESLQLKIRPLNEATPLLTQSGEFFSECIRYQEDKIFWIDYDGKAWLHERSNHEATLYVDEQDLEQELGYLYLQSHLGQIWDARGLHRLHSLSFLYSEQCYVLLIPSGGGKSTLALHLAKEKGFCLLGDDMCLVDTLGRIFPYPMRLAFRTDKDLGELEQHARLWHRRKYGAKKLVPSTALPTPPKSGGPWSPVTLIVAERWLGKSRTELLPAKKRDTMRALRREMILGLGLPQIAELLLKPGEKWRLFRTAFRRFRVARRLVKSSTSLTLQMSNDPNECASTLIHELRARLPVNERNATIL